MMLPSLFVCASKHHMNGMGAGCYRIAADRAQEFFSTLLSSQESERLELKGMSSDAGSRNILLFFDSDEGDGWLHVEIDCTRMESMPSLRSVWPVASWWEDELERFAKIRFTAPKKLEGVKWQR